MKNSKKLLIIATLVGTLASNQALYSAQEEVQPQEETPSSKQAQQQAIGVHPDIAFQFMQIAMWNPSMIKDLTQEQLDIVFSFADKFINLIDRVEKLTKELVQLPDTPSNDSEREKIKNNILSLIDRSKQIEVDHDALLKEDLMNESQINVLRELIPLDKLGKAMHHDKPTLDFELKSKLKDVETAKKFIFNADALYGINSQPIHIPLGETFSIQLKEHRPITGQSWGDPIISDGLEVTKNEYIENDPTKYHILKRDIGGIHIFNFKGTKKGPATIFIPKKSHGTSMLGAAPHEPATGYFAHFIIE